MKTLNNEFKNWLKTLGFAPSTIKSFPLYTAEMLSWLEEKNIQKIEEITADLIHTYFFYWKNRKNKRTGGGLSQSHINTGVTAIISFVRFLHQSKYHSIEIEIQRDKRLLKIPSVLTIKEIEELYEATYNNHRRVNVKSYAQRDRVMLCIYYGCGLRRSEGINLKVSDILLDQKMLLVRQGKGNKERFVPIPDKGIKDIEEYLNDGRKWFLEPRQKNNQTPQTDYFFVNGNGNRILSFDMRIKQLKEDTSIQKQFSLHSLRHSIATHLLQKGMDIEQIKKFLGHSSLESTQLYTHIINELQV